MTRLSVASKQTCCNMSIGNMLRYVYFNVTTQGKTSRPFAVATQSGNKYSQSCTLSLASAIAENRPQPHHAMDWCVCVCVCVVCQILASSSSVCGSQLNSVLTSV
jgi:hypothetical protein